LRETINTYFVTFLGTSFACKGGLVWSWWCLCCLVFGGLFVALVGVVAVVVGLDVDRGYVLGFVVVGCIYL